VQELSNVSPELYLRAVDSYPNGPKLAAQQQ
jgi:hypothetical protein